MSVKWLAWPLTVVGVVLLVWLGWASLAAPIAPAVWQPPANPGLTGPFSPNSALANADTMPMPGLGPEDVACGSDGRLYTGLEDGRIVGFSPGGEVSEIGHTAGRPLGLMLDAQGDLIIADAYRGLLRMGVDGAVETLVDSYGGRPLRFVDDLDIADDGTIYFSDASMRFQYHNNLLDFYEGSMTGRLFSFQPDTGELKLLLAGLFFGNGVALGPDDAYVLVNETGLGRVQRVWLKGPQAGTSDLFIENLPGTPDNINYDGDNTFWIAMPSLRAGVDAVAEQPVLRRLVSVLPKALQEAAATPVSFVVGVTAQGEVTANLQDPGLNYNYITSATPCGDTLWLGSLHMSAVGSLPVQANPQ